MGPTKSLKNQIINTVNEAINSNSLPPNANKLYSQQPRTSLFYMLPKIHKANNPRRPIVSAVSCPTSQIATYLDHLLTPIVKQLPTYKKDSSAALRVFNNFRFTGAYRYLFTMDVKSLYSIHTKMACLLSNTSSTNVKYKSLQLPLSFAWLN